MRFSPAVQRTARPWVVRQSRRERVVRERPLEQCHGLHRAHALGQSAQGEGDQSPTETVPDEMDAHLR